MSARYRSLVAALSLALVVLVGALLGPSIEPDGGAATPSPSAPATRVYVEGMLGRPAAISPFAARTATDRSLVALLFRGLLRLGPGDALVGDLAQRWEADSTGRTYTFHLRSGLVWQDGVPLTSADVVFTLAALADPDYTGPGGESWREVTASAPDEATVVLTLTTPLGGFLQAATQPIAPEHILGGVDHAALADDPFGREPVGSGPFRLASLTEDAATLVPFFSDAPAIDGEGGGPGSGTPRPTDSLTDPTPALPEGPVPYLPGMTFRFFDDVATLRAAWDRGELDAASGLAPADAAALGRTVGARLLRYPGSMLLAVILDLRPSHPEFRDPGVRRALLEAIDRDAIVAAVLSGQAVRADSPIPPTSPMFDPTVSKPVATDRAAAVAALTAAGWKKSGAGWTPKGATAPLTIEILSPVEAVNPTAYRVAEAVTGDWSAIGLAARHTALPTTELMGEHLRVGEFGAAVVPLAIGLDPDLYPILASSQTVSGGSNIGGLQDAALDRLLAAARAPGTDEIRKAAYKALQVRLASSQYLLPIAFRDEVVVVRDTLSGPVVRPVGAPGDRFWDVLTWRLADGR